MFSVTVRGDVIESLIKVTGFDTGPEVDQFGGCDGVEGSLVVRKIVKI